MVSNSSETFWIIIFNFFINEWYYIWNFLNDPSLQIMSLKAKRKKTFFSWYRSKSSLESVRRHNVLREVIYSLTKIPIEKSTDRGSNTGLVNGWTNDGRGCAVIRVVAGYVSQVRNSRHASLETFAYLLIFENSRQNPYSDRNSYHYYMTFCSISRSFL